MKEKMFVIATRGKQGKELYLKATERETRIKGDLVKRKTLCEWTDNIDEAIATFTITDCEDMANNYFTNYKKWYIKDFMATFK